MKKYLLILITNILFSSSESRGQLPPVAQALYDEAFNHDSMQVHNALNHGAQVIATPDSNSFYVVWFPPGTNPSTSPLIVTLHGSNGFAFTEFVNWYDRALAHGCGIVALQWFRGASTLPPNDYFDDDVIYADLDSALSALSYPTGKAFLHGFSRGAARSYSIIFRDTHGGKNYFCTTLSNSGAVNPNYPLYAQIDSGVYGNNVFQGKQWALFCGGQDTNYVQSGCPGMITTQSWLQGQGADVGIFIQDSLLGHDGFHYVDSYIDSVLNYYVTCYNSLSVPDESNLNFNLNIFPNPFNRNISVRLYSSRNQKMEIRIESLLGQVVYSKEESIQKGSYTTHIDLSDVSDGLYVFELRINGNVLSRLIRKE